MGLSDKSSNAFCYLVYKGLGLTIEASGIIVGIKKLLELI
jgi:hypothetical protein